MKVELTKEEIILIMAALDVHLSAVQLLEHSPGLIVVNDPVEHENWKRQTGRIRDKFWAACRLDSSPVG